MEKELTRREFLNRAGVLGMGAILTPALCNALAYDEALASDLAAGSASPASTLSYRAHVKDKGWLGAVGNGGTAGTVGEARRMEAFKVSLKQNGKSMVSCSAHVADLGWLGAVGSDEVVGTTGKAKGLQACKISLKGDYAQKYDVYYAMHLPDRGWCGYAKNGAAAGSTGLAVDAQAIRINIVPKGQPFDAGSVPFLQKPKLTCKGHSADLGWLASVGEGATIGTTGRAKQLEAFTATLLDFDGKNGITVQSHVANKGWMPAVSSGKTCGTTGLGYGIEAVKMELDGSLRPFFSVAYRVHVRNVGWCGWAKDGAIAGSTGLGLPIEAIQIRLLNKVEAGSFNTGGSPVVTANPAAKSAEHAVQGRLDQIANGSLRYDGRTVMSVGSTFTGTRSSEQCKGYAKNCFELCFGIVPGATKKSPSNYLINATGGMRQVGACSSMTASNAQSLFSQARPGDFVQMRRRSSGGSHSMIVYSVQADGITVLEANTDNRNGVYMHTFSWATLASKNAGMSLYTASDYASR